MITIVEHQSKYNHWKVLSNGRVLGSYPRDNWTRQELIDFFNEKITVLNVTPNQAVTP